jgi:hypothetical protein
MNCAQLVAVCPYCGETTEFPLNKTQIALMLLELRKGGGGVFVPQQCENCNEFIKVSISKAVLQTLFAALSVRTREKTEAVRRFESLCD